MNVKSILIAACVLGSGIALAEDAHHPDAANKPPAAAPAKPAEKGMQGMDMGRMQQHMKLMRAQMAQIRAATDPKEKERLIEEHFKTMEDSMAHMQHMMKRHGKM
jgi:Spy/CpxP family protein refolding chaperone